MIYPNRQHGIAVDGAVRARPGRLSALSVLHRKSDLCGAFVWVHRVFNSPKRQFPARAEGAHLRLHLEVAGDGVWDSATLGPITVSLRACSCGWLSWSYSVLLCILSKVFFCAVALLQKCPFGRYTLHNSYEGCPIRRSPWLVVKTQFECGVRDQPQSKQHYENEKRRNREGLLPACHYRFHMSGH
jgi:hypothetical protein